MKLLTATLVKNPRSVTTKYGPKIVADCKLDNGEEVTLWQPENSQIINYDNGSKLTLTLDSKGKYHWVESENETAIAPKIEPNQSQSKELSNQAKRDIAEYITQQTKLFSFCYAQTALVDNLPNEDRRQVATTLFIQAIKHFNL
jgi:hypothetical protein